MWMDHRALQEAQSITDTKHAALDQVGGVCSPEFSLAKLLWFKKNHPARFEAAEAFMELPDYLTWRCLSSESFRLSDFRPSNCSLTCKWLFDGQSKTWPSEFYKLIGLGELLNNTKKIGGKNFVARSFERLV